MIRRGHVVARYLVPERIAAAERLAGFRALLSADELRRLERLRRPGDRQRFLVSHALVRLALSQHAPVDPGDWRFATGPHGKPEIAGPAGHATLRFSLSHTPGLCACALTRIDDVGIDAERRSRRVDVAALADRMLSADEAARLAALEPERRSVAFLRHWTLREAWVKARGEGMLRVPREAVSFRVDASNDEVAARFPGQRSGRAGDWRFFIREPEGSHLCAVAVRAAGGTTVALDAGPLAPDQPSGSSSSPA